VCTSRNNNIVYSVVKPDAGIKAKHLILLFMLNSEDNSRNGTCAYDYLQVYPLPLSQALLLEPPNGSISSSSTLEENRKRIVLLVFKKSNCEELHSSVV
jgi:hypothetical protein